MARGEVVAWYQPVVDLRSGGLVGAEALARWSHPRRGLLAAGAFVDLAADAGLAAGMTDAAFAQTADLLAVLGRDRPDLTVRVNVAASQLDGPGLADRAQALLEGAGCPASMLAVEVTETELRAAGPAARRALQQLRDLGVGVALDDFGTGGSSLSLLAEVPLDAVKVHRSFVGPIADSPAHRALVASMVALGDRLGLEVVAEGVETAAQERALVELGCHRAQGFRLGAAMAPDRFVEAALGWRHGATVRAAAC